MPELARTTAVISDLFDAMGLTPVSVPILQPADPFLDSVGEDLRRRIFMTENENGDSLCLRPEFTIPVCLAHIAEGHKTPHRYAYVGEVFRQKRAGTSSFYQAGIEDLGDEDEANADARSLDDAMRMIAHVAPDTATKVQIGDQAVFAAVLEALGLPRGWQKKLMRCFGNDQQLRSVLTDLSKPAAPLSLPAHITQKVKNGDEQGLAALIEAEMLTANISPAASRTPTEIARRILEKAELSRLQLGANVLQALEAFLGIDVPLSDASATLEHFANSNILALDSVIDRFSARIAAFEKAGLDLRALNYDAAFGRPIDYYTGLVYEIRLEADQHTVLIGGGRYDRLLTMLGAKHPIPAVGFSMWLDRIGED